MSFMKLEKRGSVHVLTLTNGDRENTFNTEVLAQYHQCLDRIENHLDNSALLITSDHPKTFCNGIDLAWLLTQPPESVQSFVTALENVLLRIATLNLPVIAAINGNCYAGGAIMASACDFRLMRKDKGRFCFSEVNIKIPFTPVMTEVIRLIPNTKSLHDLALTGRAIGGDEALVLDVVNSVHSDTGLFPEALAFAEMMALKHRSTYTSIKRGLRHSVTKLAMERGILHA